MKKHIRELRDIIIEDLVDSDFDSTKHEAYGYVCDTLLGKKGNRTMGWMHRKLNSLDWEYIEEQAAGEDKLYI